jgi:hypothetical protein
VTCIARQQTDKRTQQQNSDVTGFLWSVPCPLPSNGTDKHSFATMWEGTVFYAICAKDI